MASYPDWNLHRNGNTGNNNENKNNNTSPERGTAFREMTKAEFRSEMKLFGVRILNLVLGVCLLIISSRGVPEAFAQLAASSQTLNEEVKQLEIVGASNNEKIANLQNQVDEIKRQQGVIIGKVEEVQDSQQTKELITMLVGGIISLLSAAGLVIQAKGKKIVIEDKVK